MGVSKAQRLLGTTEGGGLIRGGNHSSSCVGGGTWTTNRKCLVQLQRLLIQKGTRSSKVLWATGLLFQLQACVCPQGFLLHFSHGIWLPHCHLQHHTCLHPLCGNNRYVHLFLIYEAFTLVKLWTISPFLRFSQNYAVHALTSVCFFWSQFLLRVKLPLQPICF